MRIRASLGIALPVLALLLTAGAKADPAYWVTYQVDASVRTPPATAWTHWYSSPFGISIGYSTGVIFSDQAITDPTKPNCFSFSFFPKTSDGLTSIRQEITVTEYHGDKVCSPIDPTQIQTLGVVDMTVEQKQASTFQFPFLDGQQIEISLAQSWVVPSGEQR